MCQQVQLSFGFPTQAFRFSAADRELKAVLGRLAGRHSEVWHSTETIAAKLGVTIRAAQVRIQRFIEAGLLERVYDYALTTRRRLRLLWRGIALESVAVGAKVCADSAQEFAPVEVFPSYMCFETEEERNLSSYAAEEPLPPPVVLDPITQEESSEIVTLEDRNAIAQAADAIAPENSELKTIAQAVAVEHGPVYSLATLADMAERAKREPIRSVRKCFYGFLGAFLRSSVTPVDPRKAAADERALAEERLRESIAFFSS